MKTPWKRNTYTKDFKSYAKTSNGNRYTTFVEVHKASRRKVVGGYNYGEVIAIFRDDNKTGKRKIIKVKQSTKKGFPFRMAKNYMKRN